VVAALVASCLIVIARFILRICIYTSTFFPAVGGAEKDADMIARGLQSRGHFVGVLAQKMKGTLPELPYPVRQYRRPPSQHLCTDMLQLPLLRTLHKWRPDIVLALYAYPNAYVASRLKKSCGFKLIAAPQGADLYPNFHALRKPRVSGLIRQGYGRCDRLVVFSRWITERLHEVVGGKLPVTDFVPNGIDLDEYDAMLGNARTSPPELPVKKPYLLHLARVAPVKRQTMAVEAVHRMRHIFEEKKLQYVIVGDGNAMDEVRAMVQKLKLENIVQLLGTRNGEEKLWLIDNALFGVSTSREEAFGNVLLEFMAAGKPMLLSNIGAHVELMDGQGWGDLYQGDRVDDLCDKIERMLDADLGAMGRRAYELRSQYTIDRMIDGYEASCRQAMEGGVVPC
jgi:glycosyltransferase involved in cell wall biosynthesis